MLRSQSESRDRKSLGNSHLHVQEEMNEGQGILRIGVLGRQDHLPSESVGTF